MKCTPVGSILVAVLLLAGCAGKPPEVARDRFALASQPQVYVIHDTAANTFLIEGKYGAIPGGMFLQMNDSARTQQRFDLKDPIPYAKDLLIERLRKELGLSNLKLVSETSDLPILPADQEKPQPDYRPSMPGGGRQPSTTPAAETETFKAKYPSGAVIQLVTRHWGIERYRIKYAASLRLISLTDSKVLMSSGCSRITFDAVPQPRPTGYDAQGKFDPNAAVAYEAEVEEKLYADNGALLKAGLRKAAEICAERWAKRFVGSAGKDKSDGQQGRE